MDMAKVDLYKLFKSYTLSELALFKNNVKSKDELEFYSKLIEIKKSKS